MMSKQWELDDFQHFYFVGLAGAGMSALAIYLAEAGKKITGSDRNFIPGDASLVQQQLEAMGMQCVPQDGSAVLPGVDVLIVSTAIEDTVPDVVAAKAHNIPILRRSQLLAMITATKKTIAIGGTSGKSTTAAMLYHILEANNWQPGIITGAGLTSLIKKGEPGNAKLGSGDWLVIEADESDGSIVQYHPQIGVLLNVDKDHQDIEELMGLFTIFKNNCSQQFIVNRDNALATTLSTSAENDFGKGSGTQGKDFMQVGFNISFKVDEVLFELQMIGQHNMENALGAIAACRAIGVSLQDCSAALKSFEGIYRRHQILGCKNGVWVIDDYAHNPAKCAASIKACQDVSPKVIAWFQPHGYKPTKFLKDDFITEIAAALRPDDEIWMSEIYYAGGSAEKNISAKELTDGIADLNKKAFFVAERNDLLAAVRAHFTGDTVLLLMGARDPSLQYFAEEIWQAI